MQTTLFDYPIGGVILDGSRSNSLAVTGMNLAVESANRKEKGWSVLCWQLFLVWLRQNIKKGSEFMIEDFRADMYAKDLLTRPPSERAYGFLSHKAVRAGFIQFVRTAKVKNVKAHSANASVWEKL